MPQSGRSPGEGNGNPLQYSCLENSMDRGAWQATVHGISRVEHDLVTKPHLLDPAIIKTEHSKNKDHGIWSHHFMANRWGKNGISERLYFLGLQKSLQMVTAAMKLKDTCSLEEKL